MGVKVQLSGGGSTRVADVVQGVAKCCLACRQPIRESTQVQHCWIEGEARLELLHFTVA